MSRKPFRVGRSRTGLGLFATEPIKKGTLIVRYRGPKITAAESEKREARGNRYLYEINSKWVIDGTARSNVARYANHSCRPNSESITRGHKVFIKATKNIQPEDEITYDYGKNYFDIYLKPIGCKCVKCIEKRKKERAEKREANKRKKAREARKAAAGTAPARGPARKAATKTTAKTASRKTTSRNASSRAPSSRTSSGRGAASKRSASKARSTAKTKRARA